VKLFIHQGACSLSPHIISRELGLDVEIVPVDRKTHRTADGRDFLALNPDGYVPALELDNGEIVIEGAAIVQYLAALRPEAELVPADPRGRRIVQSLLSFIATEIHKPMAQLLMPAYAAISDTLRTVVAKRLDGLATRLDGSYLLGEQFTVADAYLFVCLNWSQWNGVDLSRWPKFEAFMQRVGKRPKVLAALAEEGLFPRAGGVFFAPR